MDDASYLATMTVITGARREFAAKRCACGACYATRAEWAALPAIGVWRDSVADLDLRNCACGSTLAVELERVVS